MTQAPVILQDSRLLRREQIVALSRRRTVGSDSSGKNENAIAKGEIDLESVESVFRKILDQRGTDRECYLLGFSEAGKFRVLSAMFYKPSLLKRYTVKIRKSRGNPYLCRTEEHYRLSTVNFFWKFTSATNWQDIAGNDPWVFLPPIIDSVMEWIFEDILSSTESTSAARSTTKQENQEEGGLASSVLKSEMELEMRNDKCSKGGGSFARVSATAVVKRELPLEEELLVRRKQIRIEVDRELLVSAIGISATDLLLEFLEQINTNEKAIGFCQRRNLIRRNPPQCDVCGRGMSYVKNTALLHDGHVWRCPSHRGRKITIRANSFFSRCNLRLSSVLLLARFWAFETPVSVTSVQTGLSRASVVQWFQYFRDVCSWWLRNNPIQLGGVGRVVQIDEIVMGRARSYRGRRTREKWVFGMYDIHQKCGIVQLVDDRSDATLLPILRIHVLPGTEIHPDQSDAYDGIIGLPVNPPYQHLTVNHGPGTGVHIKDVECFLKNSKEKFKSMHGTRDGMRDSYLEEFMWRQFHAGNGERAFDNLVLQISQWYPV